MANLPLYLLNGDIVFQNMVIHAVSFFTLIIMKQFTLSFKLKILSLDVNHELWKFKESSECCFQQSSNHNWIKLHYFKT